MLYRMSVFTVWFVAFQHLFMTARIITTLQCDLNSLESPSHLRLLAAQFSFMFSLTDKLEMTVKVAVYVICMHTPTKDKDAFLQV